MKNETNRKKYLMKNTAIFAIGNFTTKLIAFILVPFYTYVLTTEEYGVINLIFTICTVISPLLMLNLQDAVRRFLLDKNADQDAILTSECIVVAFGHIIGLCILPLLGLYNEISTYSVIIYFYLVSISTNVIAVEFLRGQEKMKTYVLCSVVSSLLVAVLNIFFLTKFHMGVKGYFLAFIIAYYVSTVIAVIAGKQYRVVTHWKFDASLFREMIKFSLPMIPNSLLWWVSSSSDHIMVSHIISTAANGIYTVSYKVPTLISTISNIFMQAWQISAIKDSDKKDSVEFSNKMLDAYIRLNVLITAGLLVIIKPFLRIYVSPEYFEAWKYTPFLIVGNTFLTLGTFVGTSYYVQKDMKGNMYSACSGAILNIILNVILIPTIGVQGAAIATCLSYIVVFIYRIFDTKKYLKLNFCRYDYLLFLIIVGLLLMLTYVEAMWHYALMLSLFIALIVLNISFIKPIVTSILAKLK